MSVRDRAAELRRRWFEFNTRVGERADSVVEALSHEYRQRIGAEATNPGALAGLLQATRARLLSLGGKIDEAWDDLDSNLDALRDEADDAEDDELLAWLSRMWTELATDRDNRRLELELRWARAEATLEADHARELRRLAANDPDARALYLDGSGLHALAHEAALEHRLDELRYELMLGRLRHPTSHDHAWVIDARTRYWTAYYTARNELAPRRAVGVAEAVRDRLAQADAFGNPVIDQQKRAFMAELVDALYQGNHRRAETALAARPHHIDLDDCTEALAERHMTDALDWLLARVHAEESVDEPLDAWRRTRAGELARLVGGG